VPRVYGTTQNEQNSLQPSMIVTQRATDPTAGDAQRKRHVVVRLDVDDGAPPLATAPRGRQLLELCVPTTTSTTSRA
jgi:hypothetical protein